MKQMWVCDDCIKKKTTEKLPVSSSEEHIKVGLEDSVLAD